MCMGGIFEGVKDIWCYTGLASVCQFRIQAISKEPGIDSVTCECNKRPIKVKVSWHDLRI